MPPRKIAIIRADASTTIGIGHVMRMMALAQALIQNGWQVTLCYLQCPTKLVAQLAQMGVSTRQIAPDQDSGEELKRLADNSAARLIVVDGYQFDDNYMQGLTGSQAIIMMMDDYQHCQQYHADVIVNQNIGAEKYNYKCQNPTAKLLLGTDYVLLRQEFLRAQRRSKAQDSAFKILITLGGSDSDNISARLLTATKLALEGLSQTTNKLYQVCLVAGAANPHKESLAALSQSYNSKHLNFELATDVSDMATLIADSSLVISAGGGTVWEAACLAVANMVVILADNQKGIAKFADLGAIVNLGQAGCLEPEPVAQKIIDFVQSPQFLTMPRIAQKLVDGRGAERIVKVIEGI